MAQASHIETHIDYTSGDMTQKKQLDDPICKLSKDIHDIVNNKSQRFSIRTFFEFVKTAYRVNDNFLSLSTMLTRRSKIDWHKLSMIDLNLDTLVDNDNKSKSNNQLFKDYATNKSENDNDENLNLIKPVFASQENTLSEYEVFPSTTSQYMKKMIPLQNVCLNFTEKEDKLQNLETTENNIEYVDRLLGNVLNLEKSKVKQCEQLMEEENQILPKIIKKNLSDILHEGLLDSVLPYMILKSTNSQPILKKHILNLDMKRTISFPQNVDNGTTTSLSVLPRERDKSKRIKRNADPNEEVEIHVCDEGKNMKKDFRCPQKLLIQKMRYFADITAGQKLEEIDISVHCDVVIFDWLMRWVKKDVVKRTEWPTLEAGNVIPIMVSASFLQMEPLLEYCLQYCHDNMSDILKTSTTLTCLNDNLLTRLAQLFTNEDVENLKDKKDKIQSRLFCKLITSLTEIEPDNKKGHYSSLATLFKCGKCNKNVVQSISNFVPCIPTAMRVDNKGIIYNKHIRDSTWSLNEYITNLRSELRSWRDVYWRLWGDCHFLSCQCCDTYFSMRQMDWCRYHPEFPQFFVNEQQQPMPFPLGRYPCCSQRAYRFEVLSPNQRGCKYKEHIPNIKTEKDTNILNIFVARKEIISIEPPQLYFPEKITRLVPRDSTIRSGKLICKETLWWNGVGLVPSRPQFGLLGKIVSGPMSHKLNPTADLGKSLNKDTFCYQTTTTNRSSTSNTSSTTYSDEDEIIEINQVDDDDDNNIVDESYDSEESSLWSSPSLRSIDKTAKKRLKISAMKSGSGKFWSSNLMVRYNQDNQRDFEERTSARMISLLTKRTSMEHHTLQMTKSMCNGQRSQIYKNILPIGGTYMKLEAEFRDRLARNSFKYKNSSTVKSSVRPKKQ